MYFQPVEIKDGAVIHRGIQLQRRGRWIACELEHMAKVIGRGTERDACLAEIVVGSQSAITGEVNGRFGCREIEGSFRLNSQLRNLAGTQGPVPNGDIIDAGG